jgi:hypothetical protein
MIEYATTLERRPRAVFADPDTTSPGTQAILAVLKRFEAAFIRKHGPAGLKALYATHSVGFTSDSRGRLVPRVRELTREEIANRARDAAPPRPGARIREHAVYLKRLRASW